MSAAPNNPLRAAAAASYAFRHDGRPDAASEVMGGHELLERVLYQSGMQVTEDGDTLRFTDRYGDRTMVEAPAADLHALRQAYAVLQRRYPHIRSVRPAPGSPGEELVIGENEQSLQEQRDLLKQTLRRLEQRVVRLARRGFEVRSTLQPGLERLTLYAGTDDDTIAAQLRHLESYDIRQPRLERLREALLAARAASRQARTDAADLLQTVRDCDSESGAIPAGLHAQAVALASLEEGVAPYPLGDCANVCRQVLEALRLAEQMGDLAAFPGTHIEYCSGVYARGRDLLRDERRKAFWRPEAPGVIARDMRDARRGQCCERLMLDTREIDRHLFNLGLDDDAAQAAATVVHDAFGTLLGAIHGVPEPSAAPAPATGEETAPAP